jgi:hypothetical protein
MASAMASATANGASVNGTSNGASVECLVTLSVLGGEEEESAQRLERRLSRRLERRLPRRLPRQLALQWTRQCTRRLASIRRGATITALNDDFLGAVLREVSQTHCSAVPRLVMSSKRLLLSQRLGAPDVAAYIRRTQPSLAPGREWDYFHGLRVRTSYNDLVYEVTNVRRDLCPLDSFTWQGRRVSFEQYLLEKYKVAPTLEQTREQTLEQTRGQPWKQLPMFEARLVGSRRRVHLVPSACLVEIREGPRGNTARLALEDVARHGGAPLAPLSTLTSRDHPHDAARGAGNLKDKLKEASRRLRSMQHLEMAESTPTQALKGEILGAPRVSFGGRCFPVEEGSFDRWLRHGLVEPMCLTNWVFLYPASDYAVLDIWLRSLRDLGKVAFNQSIAEPTRVAYASTREIVQLLEHFVTPGETQLVLLLAPIKDSAWAYGTLKRACCLDYGVPSQFMLSDRLRSRGSIAKTLAHLCLQLNSKCGGRSWRITSPVSTVSSTTSTISIISTISAASAASATSATSAGPDEAAMPGRQVSSSRPLLVPVAYDYRHCDHGLYAGISCAVDGGDIFYTTAQPVTTASTAETFKELLGEALAVRAARAALAARAAAAPSTAAVHYIILRRVPRRFWGAVRPEVEVATSLGNATVVVVDDTPCEEFAGASVGTVVSVTHPAARAAWLMMMRQRPVAYGLLHEPRHEPRHEPNVASPLSLPELQAYLYALCHLYYNYAGAVNVPAPVLNVGRAVEQVGKHLGMAPDAALRTTAWFI